MLDIVGTVGVALALIAWFSQRSKAYTARERALLWLSLAAHIASGAALTPLMTYVFGGGDMLAYHRVATSLLHLMSRDFSGTLQILVGLMFQSGDPLPVPDLGLAIGSTASMLGLSTLVMAPLGGSLYAGCVAVAGLGFWGKLQFYDVSREELPTYLHRGALFACLLVPSTVFWSSGIVKEAYAVFGLGLVVRALASGYRKRLTLGQTAGAALGFLLIALLKGFLLIPLGVAAGAVALLGTRGLGKRRSGAGRMLGIALGIGLVVAAGIFSSRYSADNVVMETARLQEVGQDTSGGSNYLIVEEPQQSLAGQLSAAPLALVTLLFRPVIFEAHNAQMAINGLEMLVFSVLLVLALSRTGPRSAIRLIARNPALTFFILFGFTAGFGVTLASTNLGSLSRYRMPAMPFLWVVGLALATRQPRLSRVQPAAERAARPARTT